MKERTFKVLVFYTDERIFKEVNLPLDGWFDKVKEVAEIGFAVYEKVRIKGHDYSILVDDDACWSNSIPSVISYNCDSVRFIGNIAFIPDEHVNRDGFTVFDRYLTDKDFENIKSSIKIINTLNHGIIGTIREDEKEEDYE